MGAVEHPLDDYEESLEIIRTEIKANLEAPGLQPTVFTLRKDKRGKHIIYKIDLAGSNSAALGESLVMLVKDDRRQTEGNYFPTTFRTIIAELRLFSLSFCSQELQNEFGEDNGKGWKLFLLSSGY